MANKQTQRQEQHQKLLPQQLMLIRLLQTPVSSLDQLVKEEIEQNPLLEDDHMCQDETPISDSTSEDSNEESREDEDFEDREIDVFADDDDTEEGYRTSDNYGEPQDRDKDPQESFIHNEISFGTYLLDQFHMKQLTDRELIIGNEIIGSIDASGYLGRQIGLIANDLTFKQNMDVMPQEVEQVLQIVQTLDPAGVGARDLKECLSLQLHRISNPDQSILHAISIIDLHFDDFTQGKAKAIMQQLNIDMAALEHASNCIRALNPKPGSAYSESSDNSYIIPDFIITQFNSTDLQLDLNENNLPELHISHYYSEMLANILKKKKTSSDDQQAVRYIREKAERAQWFIDMLSQRQVTLRRIMEAILEFQEEYFRSGMTQDLRPMRLQDIAEKSGYDISTVSRVVNQKYVQTPSGTLLLKNLFSRAFEDNEGNMVSTDAVREHLLKAVNEEDKSNPLSDEQLASLLNEKGYPVARRTVAKYRKMLDIPESRLRKGV